MIFDWTIIVLIFLSILTIILQSFDKLDAQFTNSFRYLEGLPSPFLLLSTCYAYGPPT